MLAASAVARGDTQSARQAFATSAADITATMALAVQRAEDLVVSASGFAVANPGTTNAELRAWTASVRAGQR